MEWKKIKLILIIVGILVIIGIIIGLVIYYRNKSRKTVKLYKNKILTIPYNNSVPASPGRTFLNNVTKFMSYLVNSNMSIIMDKKVSIGQGIIWSSAYAKYGSAGKTLDQDSGYANNLSGKKIPSASVMVDNGEGNKKSSPLKELDLSLVWMQINLGSAAANHDYPQGWGGSCAGGAGNDHGPGRSSGPCGMTVAGISSLGTCTGLSDSSFSFLENETTYDDKGNLVLVSYLESSLKLTDVKIWAIVCANTFPAGDKFYSYPNFENREWYTKGSIWGESFCANQIVGDVELDIRVPIKMTIPWTNDPSNCCTSQFDLSKIGLKVLSDTKTGIGSASVNITNFSNFKWDHEYAVTCGLNPACIGAGVTWQLSLLNLVKTIFSKNVPWWGDIIRAINHILRDAIPTTNFNPLSGSGQIQIPFNCPFADLTGDCFSDNNDSEVCKINTITTNWNIDLQQEGGLYTISPTKPILKNLYLSSDLSGNSILSKTPDLFILDSGLGKYINYSNPSPPYICPPGTVPGTGQRGSNLGNGWTCDPLGSDNCICSSPSCFDPSSTWCYSQIPACPTEYGSGKKKKPFSIPNGKADDIYTNITENFKQRVNTKKLSNTKDKKVDTNSNLIQSCTSCINDPDKYWCGRDGNCYSHGEQSSPCRKNSNACVTQENGSGCIFKGDDGCKQLHDCDTCIHGGVPGKNPLNTYYCLNSDDNNSANLCWTHGSNDSPCSGNSPNSTNCVDLNKKNCQYDNCNSIPGTNNPSDPTKYWPTNYSLWDGPELASLDPEYYNIISDFKNSCLPENAAGNRELDCSNGKVLTNIGNCQDPTSPGIIKNSKNVFLSKTIIKGEYRIKNVRTEAYLNNFNPDYSSWNVCAHTFRKNCESCVKDTNKYWCGKDEKCYVRGSGKGPCSLNKLGCVEPGGTGCDYTTCEQLYDCQKCVNTISTNNHTNSFCSKNNRCYKNGVIGELNPCSVREETCSTRCDTAPWANDTKYSITPNQDGSYSIPDIKIKNNIVLDTVNATVTSILTSEINKVIKNSLVWPYDLSYSFFGLNLMNPVISNLKFTELGPTKDNIPCLLCGTATGTITVKDLSLKINEQPLDISSISIDVIASSAMSVSIPANKNTIDFFLEYLVVRKCKFLGIDSNNTQLAELLSSFIDIQNGFSMSCLSNYILQQAIFPHGEPLSISDISNQTLVSIVKAVIGDNCNNKPKPTSIKVPKLVKPDILTPPPPIPIPKPANPNEDKIQQCKICISDSDKYWCGLSHSCETHGALFSQCHATGKNCVTQTPNYSACDFIDASGCEVLYTCDKCINANTVGEGGISPGQTPPSEGGTINYFCPQDLRCYPHGSIASPCNNTESCVDLKFNNCGYNSCYGNDT